MKDKILIMLDLQDAMNTKVNNDWVNQNFSWYRAIWVESAELLDHYGWKWWKKQALDTEQVKLELVDIWHFGLSILLLGSENRKNIASDIAEELSNGKPSNKIFISSTLSIATPALPTSPITNSSSES